MRYYHNMGAKIINPILSGFYPDPSICVANDKFYLITSSFAYFPGLPIFESTNIYQWTQIGNIIDRESQLDFSGTGVSRGLFAPTIRHFNGKFYCVCTMIDTIGNFILSAENPEGPWSNPIKIEGADGIDPSLFFDDDGTCWYVGTHTVKNPRFWGDNEIYMQKINPDTGELYGQVYGIWYGALKDCVWVEGPHVYKLFGKYYLIYAEGGTGSNHCVCVARADSIDGKWEGKPANPILTHRHLGKTAGVKHVGHGDLFCDKDGKWWMVCLGSRPYGEGNEKYCNMGRETFMVPVVWEDDWPVVAPETGKIENVYTLTGRVTKRLGDDADPLLLPVIDDFTERQLGFYWLSLRKRNPEYIVYDGKSGSLRLYGQGPLGGNGDTSFLARRQSGFSYEACTKVACSFANVGDTAGLVCFQNEKFNYRLQLVYNGRVILLQLVRASGGDDEILNELALTGGTKNVEYVLRIVAEKQKLHFEYGIDERNMTVLADNIDATILSYEKAGGFVGTTIGMFAVASGDITKKEFFADFDFFKYENSAKDWIS